MLSVLTSLSFPFLSFAMFNPGNAAIAQPTNYPDAGPNSVLPMGGNLTNGVDHGDPGLGGSFKQTKGKFWNDGIQTEVPINNHYYMDRNTWTRQSAGAKQCIYGTKLPGPAIKNVSTYVRGYTMYGTPHLNYRFAYNPVFDKLYNSEKDMVRFREHFGFMGVQPDEVPSFKNPNNFSLVQKYHVGRRARITCPHVMLKNHIQNRDVVQDMDHLFWITRKVEVEDAIVKLFSVKRQRLWDGEERKSNHVPQAMEDEPEQSDQPRRVWRKFPYVSYDGAVPPVALYENIDLTMHPEDAAKSYWIGDYDRIGVVTSTYGNLAYSAKNATNAQAYLFPTADSEDYKLAGQKLPEVVVSIGVQ